MAPAQVVDALRSLGMAEDKWPTFVELLSQIRDADFFGDDVQFLDWLHSVANGLALRDLGVCLQD
ncbi:MAG: hypothetical protein JSR83_22420 [Proteobacteria bacterium]|nr:hypothetical protein [Pseudomonadota bacterium]